MTIVRPVEKTKAERRKEMKILKIRKASLSSQRQFETRRSFTLEQDMTSIHHLLSSTQWVSNFFQL